jgi:hypothetical protein
LLGCSLYGLYPNLLIELLSVSGLLNTSLDDNDSYLLDLSFVRHRLHQ